MILIPTKVMADRNGASLARNFGVIIFIPAYKGQPVINLSSHRMHAPLGTAYRDDTHLP